MVEFRYTSSQVARGARPDAVSGSKAWLLKYVSCLRLTYQIRLLTFLATERGERLIIRVPRRTRLSTDLRAFVRDHRSTLRVERVD